MRALPPTLLRAACCATPPAIALGTAGFGRVGPADLTLPWGGVGRRPGGLPGATEYAVPPHGWPDWLRASACALRAGTQFAPTTCILDGNEQECKAIGAV